MPCLFTKGHRYAVAFSGGLDSTTLLYMAHKIAGDDVVALLGTGVNFPQQEQREAEDFCCKNNIALVKIPFDFTAVTEFVENTPERCYYCKRALFSLFKSTAEKFGAELVDGTNQSDVADYRPGRRAAEELGVRSPFLEAGMGKEKIRSLAKELGLGVWDKPSVACLASRVITGEKITTELLKKIDAAEIKIRKLGLSQVRVRVLSEMAVRVEVELFCEDFRKVIESIITDVFSGVEEIDFGSYRTGSANLLKKHKNY